MINAAVPGSRHDRDSAYRDWSSVMALRTLRVPNFDRKGSTTPWRIHYWVSHCLPTNNEVIRLLCNLSIHDSIHRNVPLELILNQMKPVCILRLHFFKIHFDIVIPIKAGHSIWSLPINFSTIIQTNQPTRCNNSSSLLLDVYAQLNMFRASSRPSSGAYNCSSSIWFYRWSVVIAVLLAGRPDHDQQHCYHHAPTVKPEAATAVVSSS